MRRKIELYIADQLADISSQDLVLFNYAFTDMENPAAVKNSYSKQITLPGTPANAAIFAHIARPDYIVDTGFNPLSRTPFTIYNELGEILASGYCRLDEVKRKGATIQSYKVSLFGGLGSFLYALSYDGAGNKLTLADLDYLDGAADELDFNITAANVLAAWARIAGTISEYNSIWDVINFAPAYNGIPDGEFDADKGIALASTLGLPTGITVDDKTYDANGGYVLVNLAQKHTEWDVKDLRCYLQRPVLSMRAFLVAVGKWAVANGYEFEYSDIPVEQYKNLWKTLPMLPSLGVLRRDEGELVATPFAGDLTTSGSVIDGGANITGVSVGQQVTATLVQDIIRFFSVQDYGQNVNTGDSILFVQMAGYYNGTLVGYSNAKCYGSGAYRNFGANQIAEIVGYTPFGEMDIDDTINVQQLLPRTTITGGYLYDMYIGGLTIQANTAINQVKLVVTSFHFDTHNQVWSNTGLQLIWGNTGSEGQASGATSGGTSWAGIKYTASYRSQTTVRSGALIEKTKLLASKYTPAEYLLSLGVQFGWVFTYDEVEKKLIVRTRNGYFNTGLDAIDLTKRVDIGKEITITPVYAGACVYEFKPEVAMGHFAEEYAKAYGIDYGIQRIDTGYQFDGTPQNLLEKSKFRAAATILEHGPYWNYITYDGILHPSVFLDKGNTYTMWAPDGTNMEFNIPIPPSSATIDYINAYGNDGYDKEFAWKLDLHDTDGKAIDGEDILVVYSGFDLYDHFHVSDDEVAMFALNNNKPCWNLTTYTDDTYIVNFQRYWTDTEWEVLRSLDFGTPKEVDIPYVDFNSNSPAYVRSWAAFIRDRYNRNTKVMKCRVDFRGLQVGPEILRRFFYYENTYWVLNKINNYSLTTWDTVECEFIQVQDMSNYTSGQLLP